MNEMFDRMDRDMESMIAKFKAYMAARGLEFDESSFQDPIPKSHTQEPSNQIDEEEALVKPSPMHNDQEVIQNREEEEKVRGDTKELLEEVVPKRKKRKSNRRRKKITSQPKVDSRLKRTKNIKKKLSPRLKSISRLKRKTKRRRRKFGTGMKTGTGKGLGGSVNNNFEDPISTEAHVKNVKMRIQYQFLERVHNSRPCFNWYQRCEVYKARRSQRRALCETNWN